MAQRMGWRVNRARFGFHTAAELLEPRLLLSGMTFDVSTTADSGDGSLRMAITEANAAPGSTIDFKIDQGPSTINVLTPLPQITAPVLIDGTSQPGYAGTPLVTVNGQIRTAPASGFVFVKGSAGSVIQGLAVTGFGLAGIEVDGATNVTIGGSSAGLGNVIYGNTADGVRISGPGASGNTVAGNVIGLDASAERPLANGIGIQIDSGAAGNLIGGLTAATRNVISGNTAEGVRITGAGTSGNTVEGNDIGTDETAMKAVGNQTGVGIDSGATANIIGGAVPAARNVISGNTTEGVRITGAGTSGNTVAGNDIGTDGTAMNAVANQTGVGIDSAATANIIGGIIAAASNVISGNRGDGVRISGAGTSGNTVEGNLIGICQCASGPAPLGNDRGVEIDSGATANLVGGTVAGAKNIISSNTTEGVRFTGSGTTGNVAEGNFIGTAVSGQTPLGNDTGVEIDSGAMANTIGGSGAAGNVVSGNLTAGVVISGAGTSGNMVEGNTIGAGVSGQSALPNGTGVEIYFGATANTVGGSIGVTGNLISGNTNDGVLISDSGTSGNTVAGNLIGTGVSGQTILANANGVEITLGATANTVGGNIATARNVVSANTSNGVLISGGGTSGNTIEGNFIGTDITGQLALGNVIGVLVIGGSATTIGGTTPGAGNVISGNITAGIEVNGAGTAGTKIEGNFIGANPTGTAAVARTGQTDPLVALQNAGVAIISSQGNVIGGTTLAARNVISGNYVGVNLALLAAQGNPNRVLGNLIGTDASGERPLGNIVGIYLNGAAGNVVGSVAAGSANVISGNTSVGVEILGSGSTGNLIQANLIGPAANGQGAFVGPGGVFIQSHGVFIQDASGNMIGGPSSGTGNVISGNDAAGVFILSLSGISQGNTIQSNLIGLSQSGRPTLGNAGYGIVLDNAPTTPSHSPERRPTSSAATGSRTSGFTRARCGPGRPRRRPACAAVIALPDLQRALPSIWPDWRTIELKARILSSNWCPLRGMLYRRPRRGAGRYQDEMHTTVWRRIDRLLALFVTLTPGLAMLPSRGAEPGCTSPIGAVRLGSGITAHYAYYYNRNALADVVLAGDSVIALTDSGNLLRFDRASLKLTREWFGPVPVTCLGRAEGEAVLAGFADGRVCRIDQATLRMTELARLAGRLQWAGTMAAAPGPQPNSRLVAVFEQSKKVEIRGRKYDVPYSVVGDVASGKTYVVEPRSEYPSDLRATAFLLDQKHRLWLGADNGEWGGWCYCVDLDAGQIRSVAGQRIYQHTPELNWHGVYGFTELRDGQVWAYGGFEHFSTEGFVWRVDGGKSEELYRSETDPRLPTDRPGLPITYVVEDIQSGRITVVAYSDIYWTDTRSRCGERNTRSTSATEAVDATRWVCIPRYARSFPSRCPGSPWK